MKLNLHKFLKTSLLTAGALAVLAACNKDVDDPKPLPAPSNEGQTAVEGVAADANLSIFRAAITRASTNTSFGASLSSLLSDRTGRYTIFAPTDAAFQAAFQFLGIPANVGINALRPGQLDTILRYHIVGGQMLTADAVPTSFPNLQLPTLFPLQAPSAALPPGLRQSLFVSRRGSTVWVNNVPVVQAGLPLANAVVHRIGAVLLPPSNFLWNRIDTDPNLTYLRAAVLRADVGSTPATSLVAALSNPGANLTVFAPTNAAFRTLLTGLITQALVGRGVDPVVAAGQAATLAADTSVFNNAAVTSVLTPQLVQGVVSYHVLGTRAFSVNLPTTITNVPTLVNRAVPSHPGVGVQATFGLTGVTAATVKGVVNATASNVAINPTPAPAGTSDQNHINGVLHVIDQVLRPQ